MKLQTLSVIFVIILIPVIIITSYYIQLQSDTINLQTSYTSKLLDATKAAMEAFEINTVQLNSAFSETADSKRRDTMASINTFTTSLANGLGVGGAGNEYILSYVPAIAYTLYEGYYIYAPAETRKTIKDENGVTVFFSADNEHIVTSLSNLNEGDILYEPADHATAEGNYNGESFTTKMEDAATEYKHVLKPFTSYSERLTDSTKNVDVTINYTLDNYIRVYGTVEGDDGSTTEFVSKSGYLINTNKVQHFGSERISDLSITSEKGGAAHSIEPEILHEEVVYFTYGPDGLRHWENANMYQYVYDVNKNKIYWDGSNWFKISATGERNNIDDLTTPVYKELSVPRKVPGTPTMTYAKYYCDLKTGTWYSIQNDDVSTKTEVPISEITNKLGSTPELTEDYSAINYYVESYIFTKWIQDKIGNAETEPDELGNTEKPFDDISSEDAEKYDSDFFEHKSKVIQETLNADLKQCITSYSRNAGGYQYSIPEIKETDWDQILKNVSIVTFFQGVPAGTKYYNNYAIATSTNNKEFVDPEQFYFINYDVADDADEAHKELCEHANETNYRGHRNIDFMQKSFFDEDNTHYYTPHKQTLDYECLIDLSKYKSDYNSGANVKVYDEAVARERYIARNITLPGEVEPGAVLYLAVYEDDTPMLTDSIKYNFTVNGITKESVSGNAYNLSKSQGENNYIIDARSATTQPTDTIEVTSDVVKTMTDLQEVEPDRYEEYKSDSYMEITTNKLGSNFSYTVKNNLIESGWKTFKFDEVASASELMKDTNGWKTNGGIQSYNLRTDGATGIIAKVKVTKNFRTTDDKDVHLYAIIKDSNKITLATRIKGITGNIRLKFENAGKTYYSKNIFNIKGAGEHTIKYEITDETWKQSEWKVTVETTKGSLGTNLGYAYVEHYEIEDKNGLKAFRNEVNNEMKTFFQSGGINSTAVTYYKKLNESNLIRPGGTYNTGNLVAADGIYRRRFFLTQNIDLGGETFTPIAARVNNQNRYFDGYFDGGENKVSNVKMECNQFYNFIGFFGNLGHQSTVKNLTLENIKVNLESLKSIQNGNYYAGGLAGYADSARNDYKDLIDSTISNVKIQNSTILGTSYVGGIVGKSCREIANSEVSNSEVQSLGNVVKDIKNYIYIGGITGYAEAPITNSKISGLGDKEIKLNGSWQTNFNKGILGKSQSGENDMYMYIGGIVGFTTNNVENCDVSGYNVGGSNINPSTEDFTENAAYVEYYVGGYVGKCQNGKISFESNKEINSTVKGGLQDERKYNSYKSYTGGLIGRNTGSKVSEVTNRGTVSSSGYNVGGIVGYNENKTIENCFNKATIKGEGNVAGIAGKSSGGKIIHSGNDGEIEGKDNTNKLNSIVTWWWNIGGSLVTGTGGIAGKTQGTTIEQTYNTGNITCNFNGGGITGIDGDGIVRYCYNKGNIKAETYGRVGGICGASRGIDIYKSYNDGFVTGNITNANAGDLTGGIKYGVGGLLGVGFSHDFTYSNEGGWYIRENDHFNKIEDFKFGAIWAPIIIKEEPHEIKIEYCYNTKEPTGGYEAGILHGFKGGITGFGFYVPAYGSPVYTKNYYLGNYGGKNYEDKADSYQGINSEQDFITQLYRWATPGARNGGLASGSTYIYNTISPVEKDKGYNGYGVLFWELEGYYRQKFQIYDNKGPVIYDPARLNIDGKTVDIYLDKDLNDNLYSQNHTFNGTRFSALNGRTFKLHTYVLMLKQGSYKCKAEVSHYKDPEEKIVNVNSNDQTTLLYAGDRPEFIIAIRQEFGERTRTVPAGKYYVIASGGGGGGNRLEAPTKKGGGSGAAYRGLINLEEAQYTFSVGKGGTKKRFRG